MGTVESGAPSHGPYARFILISPSPAVTTARLRRFGASVRSIGERFPLALVALGVLLYSTGPVMLQASSVSGPVFSFWRLWLGTAVLWVAVGVVHLRSRVGAGPRHRREVTPPGRAGWRWPVIAGVFFGVHQLMFMSAVKMTTVVDVALMNALAPIITALGAWWLFRERPGGRFWAWSLIAIAGGAYLAVGASSGPAGNIGGMTLAVLNVAFFAGFFLASKRSRGQIGVLPFLAGTMGTAALVVTSWILVSSTDVGTVTSTDLWLTFAVAVGPGAIGHFVMTWPLAFVPANIPPVMRLAQPAIAGILAWMIVGEALTWTHLLGGLVVVVGAAGAISSRDGKRLRIEARRSAPQPAR
ncbi:DMT family transporter [Euzebya tangerina]|uniref:DMT family transporter n=1 Tax=Euzebya tangerina TaxID=591198 RepID=UPI000E317CA0|nr:DMT family transporter [Euzebya tangerina]